MHKDDGLRGRGGAKGAVVETRSIREISEGHVQRYFGGVKGAAAIGIWKVCQGRGRGVGGD